MASAIVGALFNGGLTGVAKVIDSIRGKSPEDAAKLAQITADIQELSMKYAADIQAAQVDLQKAQIEVNKTEATNGNIFVSGWRPGVGWVCVTAYAAQFVIGPFCTWIAALAHHPIVFPTLDLTQLGTLLFGVLGLGAYRTYEKVNGVDAGH